MKRGIIGVLPYTRITEHKHFTPWEVSSLKKTVYFREYSRLAGENDIPYYPIRLATETKMLNDYISLASKTKKISFLGRLGTYRYLDMDVTILEALNACRLIDEVVSEKGDIPAFFVKCKFTTETSGFSTIVVCKIVSLSESPFRV